MRYKTVDAPSIKALSQPVSEAMADGWQCQGSPFWNPSALVWCQAMTRGPQEDGVKLKEPKR